LPGHAYHNHWWVRDPNTRGLKADEIESIVSSSGYDGVMTIATLDPGYDYDAGDYMVTSSLKTGPI